jgi:hypothetical protein
MVELDEIDIEEKVDVASEYFYELGLNEYGVDILIEELGIEQFVDFVYEIYEECTLSESRTLIGKKKTPATGKDRGVSLKAAPGKTTKSAVEKYGTTRKLSSASSSTRCGGRPHSSAPRSSWSPTCRFTEPCSTVSTSPSRATTTPNITTNPTRIITW